MYEKALHNLQIFSSLNLNRKRIYFIDNNEIVKCIGLKITLFLYP